MYKFYLDRHDALREWTISILFKWIPVDIEITHNFTQNSFFVYGNNIRHQRIKFMKFKYSLQDIEDISNKIYTKWYNEREIDIFNYESMEFKIDVFSIIEYILLDKVNDNMTHVDQHNRINTNLLFQYTHINIEFPLINLLLLYIIY